MSEVREITIRQFQRNMYRELEFIPFIVTRKGLPWFTVTDVMSSRVVAPKVVVPEPEVTPKEPEEEEFVPGLSMEEYQEMQRQSAQDRAKYVKCEMPCKSMSVGFFHVSIPDSLEGTIHKDKYLCEFHRELAGKEGKVSLV